MSDPRERDHRELTRSARQFRRIARLAGVDPLRLLPPDPLIRLASLTEPLAVLIEVAPFEGLRETLAPAQPTNLSNASRARARAQPLAPSAPIRRPHTPATLADGTGSSAARRDADSIRVSRNTMGSPGNEGRRREELARSPVSAALAQRRAELRRGVLPGGHPSQPLSSGSGQRFVSSGDAAASPLPSVTADALAAGARGTDGPIPVAHSPQPSGTEPAWVDHGVARATFFSSPARKTDSIHASAGVVDSRSVAVFRAPGAFPSGVSARTGAPLPGAEIDAPLSATGLGCPAAPFSAPADSPLDVGPRNKPAEFPAASAAHPLRSWDRNAGLELTDDLFELLYRNGLDLSWP